MNKFAAVLIVALSLAGALQGQTKSETKLYKTTISNGDLKSLNKFITKYPQSAYTKELIYKRDSIVFHTLPKKDVFAFMNFIKEHPQSEFLQQANEMVDQLNTSAIQPEQAASIAKQILQLPNHVFYAKEMKSNNREYIAAIFPSGEQRSPHYRIVVLQQNGNTPLEDIAGWSILSDKTEQRYIQNEKLTTFTLPGGTDALKNVTLNGEKYLHFNYINEGKGADTEFITNLYSLQFGTVYSAMFSGKKEKEGNAELIEGNCMDASQGGALATEQMNYLLTYLKKQPFLQPVSKEKVQIDNAIEWWYNANKPNASTLSFGILPDTNPIVKAFTASKKRERSGQWDVAFFEIRGTTVVAAYDKNKKQYVMVWCEPAPKDKKTDKFLNTIYFEKDSTLALFYYKGNTTSKKRINLASKSMW